MENILKSILEEYGRLLELYEKIYENFKFAAAGDADGYISVMNKNSQYLEPISIIQKNIEGIRRELKKTISSDILIDSVLDEYSQGRVSETNSRIVYIIKSIREYEENGMAALEEEMERIACGLEDLGVIKF